MLAYSRVASIPTLSGTIFGGGRTGRIFPIDAGGLLWQTLVLPKEVLVLPMCLRLSVSLWPQGDVPYDTVSVGNSGLGNSSLQFLETLSVRQLYLRQGTCMIVHGEAVWLTMLQ